MCMINLKMKVAETEVIGPVVKKPQIVIRMKGYAQEVYYQREQNVPFKILHQM